LEYFRSPKIASFSKAIDFLVGICQDKGQGEKGKETQNPFPLTKTFSLKVQKHIFARGLMSTADYAFAASYFMQRKLLYNPPHP
jgi:hypothetical protein